jgi:hypothetical protein
MSGPIAVPAGPSRLGRLPLLLPLEHRDRRLVTGLARRMAC